MLEIGIAHYLVVSAIVLCAGIAVMATKRNAIGVLIGAELVLNAAALNFAAFGRFRADAVDGQVIAVFVIVLAAAETALALAIFLNFYANHASIDVDEGATLKG